MRSKKIGIPFFFSFTRQFSEFITRKTFASPKELMNSLLLYNMRRASFTLISLYLCCWEAKHQFEAQSRADLEETKCVTCFTKVVTQRF